MSSKLGTNCNTNVCELDNEITNEITNENNTENNSELINIENITDHNDLRKIIMDFTNDKEYRLLALKHYNNICEFNQTIDIIYTLSSMYQFSGIKSIEVYLYEVCTNNLFSDLSPFIKLEAIRGLLGFEEVFIENLDKEEQDIINQRIIKRKLDSYTALSILCSNPLFNTLPAPCKYEAIIMLMFSNNDIFTDNCSKYFNDFINNTEIESDYRYKSIISLEEKKDSLGKYIIKKDYYIENGMYLFLANDNNIINYRILSSQYLLQKSNNLEYKKYAENKLLDFAKNINNEYDRRADSADVLLRLALSENIKEEAKTVIVELGKNGNKNIKTLFENAQNVHNIEVEKSVIEILEYLFNLSLLKIDDNQEITFDYVKNQINRLIKNNIQTNICEKSKICKHKYCKYCNSCIKRTIETFYCSKECANLYKKYEKINTSLNRIYLDRALYSKYNISLIGILLKIWSYIYIGDHNNSDEMIKRLFEELDEMSNTCSSGFASRLINVISGFGEFNIRISWEDQIISNFTGRLNALARKITELNSPYFTTLKDEVIKLWEKNNGEIYDSKKISLEECVEDFAANVVTELTIDTSDYVNRKNFLLFLRTNIPIIKEEMYQEFKEHLSDTDFDLYMRKSIMLYETGDIY